MDPITCLIKKTKRVMIFKHEKKWMYTHMHTVDTEEYNKIACFPIAYLSRGYSGKDGANVHTLMCGGGFGGFMD